MEVQDIWKMISLEEQIKKQEETVLKVKEKYDSEMMKLKDLYAKKINLSVTFSRSSRLQ